MIGYKVVGPRGAILGLGVLRREAIEQAVYRIYDCPTMTPYQLDQRWTRLRRDGYKITYIDPLLKAIYSPKRN